eukprot:9471977-Pyramimonas_sp.AAC.2
MGSLPWLYATAVQSGLVSICSDDATASVHEVGGPGSLAIEVGWLSGNGGALREDTYPIGDLHWSHTGACTMVGGAEAASPRALVGRESGPMAGVR